MPGTLGALNAITAPDTVSTASTLEGEILLDHVNLDVINQAVYWQIKQVAQAGYPPQTATWQPEVFMGPGSRTIDRPGMTGIRVRAAVKAAALPAGSLQAVVTAEAVMT